MHGPVCLGLADFEDEIAQDVISIHGMAYFGVELERINFLFCIFRRRKRAGFAFCDLLKAGSQTGYLVAVGHPDGLFGWKSVKKKVFAGYRNFCASVFLAVGCQNLSPEVFHDSLHAVADAEKRNAGCVNCGVALRRVFGIDGVGASGKNNAFYIAEG